MKLNPNERCYKCSFSPTNRKNNIYIYNPYFQHRNHKSEPEAVLIHSPLCTVNYNVPKYPFVSLPLSLSLLLKRTPLPCLL